MADSAEDAFVEAMELAEQMLEDGPAATKVAWRWNDLEA